MIFWFTTTLLDKQHTKQLMTIPPKDSGMVRSTIYRLAQGMVS
jgi:hypothetical protein